MNTECRVHSLLQEDPYSKANIKSPLEEIQYCGAG